MNGLKHFFEPKNVAVIGASRDQGSVGYGITKNLLTGGMFESPYARPFKGKIFPVNPNAKNILGLNCYASVKDVPAAIDLAVVSVPAKIVPYVLKECAEKKVKAAIVVSAGFAEKDAEGKRLQDEIAAITRKSGMRLLGPNTLGVINPCNALNASFGLTTPRAGSIAFLSQSGALADSVIDWAIEERYSFRSIVSLGNMADVDSADLVKYFAEDTGTKVIACYFEGVKDGKKFMDALREAKRKGKHVIVLKGGRTEGGKKTVASHTGSMAGSFSVLQGALRQCGALSADSLEELFDIAKVLDEQPKPAENAFAIVSNAGGAAVLLADYCDLFGVKLVELKEETLKKLDSTGLMHPAYSRRNPLDLVGDALPERYEAAVNILLAEKGVHGLIVAQTLQTMTDSVRDAEILVKAKKRFPSKPVVSVFMGGRYSKKGVRLLEKNNVPDYNDPKKAVKAVAALCGLL